MSGLAKFAAAIAALTAVVPALAQGDALDLLSRLEKGAWEVRDRDTGAVRRICLTTGTELIQLRHSGSACKRFVLDNDADMLTVQYTCPGNGYGRTSIRRETNRLVQIESQGITNDRPYQFSAEARYSGPCR